MANNDYYFCFDVNDSKIAYEVKKECEKLGLKIRIPNDSRRGASLVATMTTNFHTCNRIVFFLTENLLMNITWVHLLADPHVRDLLLFNSDANTLIPIWYATPLLIRKYAPFFYGRIPIYGSDGSTDAASCLADIAKNPVLQEDLEVVEALTSSLGNLEINPIRDNSINNTTAAGSITNPSLTIPDENINNSTVPSSDNNSSSQIEDITSTHPTNTDPDINLNDADMTVIG